MKRRSFFTGILQSVAAIAVASSMEVFGMEKASLVGGLDSGSTSSVSSITIWERLSDGGWMPLSKEAQAAYFQEMGNPTILADHYFPKRA